MIEDNNIQVYTTEKKNEVDVAKGRLLMKGYKTSALERNRKGWNTYMPLIISEVEEIVPSDVNKEVYDFEKKEIVHLLPNLYEIRATKKFFKILAYPEHIPLDTALHILIKDDCTVYLELQYFGHPFHHFYIKVEDGKVVFTKIESNQGPTWDEVFVLPNHYNEESQCAYAGRGNHSISKLEDIIENHREVIHQLRLKIQNAKDNFHPPINKS